MGLFRRGAVERRDVSASTVLQMLARQREGSGFDAPVDTDSAMRLSAVWACVRLIAGVGSTFPLDQQRDRDGLAVEVPRSPLWTQPAPDMSLTTWLWQLWSSGLTAGNFYGLVTGMLANGYPSTVEPVDPGCVTWEQASDGSWRSRVDGVLVDRWPSGPLFHIPFFTQPGRPFGMSPVQNARVTINAGLQAEKFGTEFFTGGGIPNAVIYSENELTAEQSTTIKDRFLDAVAGRAPAVMGAGLKYERIAVDPEDSQFLDAQRFTVEQIARIYGVFPEMIGAATSGSSVTYANREQRAADWLSFGLMPYLIPIEDGLSTLVPRPQRVKFNTSALLRSDTKTRYETHAVGITNRFLTVNEARAFEDMPPLDGGDEFPEPVAPGASTSGSDQEDMTDDDDDES